MIIAVEPSQGMNPPDSAIGLFHARKSGTSQIHLKDSPGITYLARRSGLSPSIHGNLTKGWDGTSQSGYRAVRALQRLTYDLEALGASPRHLLTLTVSEDISPDRFRRAKGGFLGTLSKRTQRIGGSALWFQQFQGNGNPHLHVYLDLPGGWNDLLEWARATWVNALGIASLPAQAVDLRSHTNFGYVRSASALAQANAPQRAKWGKWHGVLGAWNQLRRDAIARTASFPLDEQAADAILDDFAQYQLTPAVHRRLGTFRHGSPSVPTIWIAKRLVSLPKQGAA